MGMKDLRLLFKPLPGRLPEVSLLIPIIPSAEIDPAGGVKTQ
jgi:hypothetical protein